MTVEHLELRERLLFETPPPTSRGPRRDDAACAWPTRFRAGVAGASGRAGRPARRAQHRPGLVPDPLAAALAGGAATLPRRRRHLARRSSRTVTLLRGWGADAAARRDRPELASIERSNLRRLSELTDDGVLAQPLGPRRGHRPHLGRPARCDAGDHQPGHGQHRAQGGSGDLGSGAGRAEGSASGGHARAARVADDDERGARDVPRAAPHLGGQRRSLRLRQPAGQPARQRRCRRAWPTRSRTCTSASGRAGWHAQHGLQDPGHARGPRGGPASDARRDRRERDRERLRRPAPRLRRGHRAGVGAALVPGA